MRDVFALSAPQPSTGWGFRFSKRIALAMLMVVALGGAVPAHAANVTVKVRIAAGGHAGAIKDCAAVSVPAGANGLTVLGAAVAQGCIKSFQTASGGAYVTCIDPGQASLCEVAGGLVTFWAVYDNGRASTTGISGFAASQGRELAFAYTNFLTCFATYPSCPL
ncbi:MAG TPA: hypothetical protein VM841_02635 [Actinomycetota bacterium]|nr:hypothetical protein [Actinomycetota bacterium]